MAADRLFQIEGAASVAGRRHVQVRVATDGAGLEFQMHELYLILPNGDWEFVDNVNAEQAIRWLMGEDD